MSLDYNSRGFVEVDFAVKIKRVYGDPKTASASRCWTSVYNEKYVDWMGGWKL